MKPTYEELERYGRQADITIENLEQRLADSRREFRAADATIENLQMQVEKLAAEGAGLAAELQSVKAMNDCLSEELRGYESDGAFEGPKMHLLWWQCETPSHDAFLAEVRAQGVDMFALMFAEEAIKTNNITTGWRARASRAASEYAEALREDAALLRKGVQS